MRGDEIIIEALKAEGISHIFGLAGSSILSILDLIYKSQDIRYIQSQHEQGAIYMANGYSRSARSPAICLFSPGAGVTNALPGVAQAFYTFTPTIVLAAEENAKSYNLGASAGHPLDAVSLYKSVTKLAVRVECVENILDTMRMAFRTALSDKRGPVYLGFPSNILHEFAECDISEPHSYRMEKSLSGNKDDISKTAQLLVDAHNPIALADGQIAWTKSEEALQELGELLAMPIAVNEGHNGLISEDHPLSLGVASRGISPPALEMFQNADVLLMLGCTLSEGTTCAFGNKIIPKGARLIQIDTDPKEIGKLYSIDLGLIGDPGYVVKDLLKEIKKRKIDRRPIEEVGRIKDWIKCKREWEDHLLPFKESAKVPIQRYRLFHDLRKALPRDAIVSAGAGGTDFWFDHAFQSLTHTTYTYSSGWRVVGSQIGEALGAKLALPDRMVVCIISDGSLMMSVQEILTAVNYDLPVLFVIIHNDVYGNMRYYQMRDFGNRSIGTDILLPNLANIAHDFGAYAERVEKPEEIIPTVQRAIESRRPAFLDVIIDKSPENLLPLSPFKQ